MNSSAAVVFFMLVGGLALAMASGCEEISSESFTRPQPIYAVWDLEFTTARDIAGQKFRVASVSNLPSIDRSHILMFGGQRIPSYTAFGHDGLPQEWSFPATGLKPGESREFQLHAQEIYSIFHHEKIQARGIESAEARGRATLVASCPVDVVFRNVRAIQSKTSGMWTVPTIGIEKRAEISQPTCYKKTDREFRQAATPALSPEVESEIERSQELSKAENEKQRLQKMRLETARQETARIFRAAREREKNSPFQRDASKTDFESQIRNALCPRESAIAEEIGVEKIVVERKEVERKKHKGYTSVRYESSMTIHFKSGRTSKFTHALDGSRIVFAIRSLTPSADGCFQVEAIANRQYDDSQLVDATARTLREIFKRDIEDFTYESASTLMPAEAP